MEKIGDRIKLMRNTLKLTQVELANKLNTTQSTILRYEKNIIVPSVNALEIMAHVLHINTHWLLTGQGPMFLNENIEKEKELSNILKDKSETYNNKKEELKDILEYLKENPDEIESIHKIIETKKELKKNIKNFIDT